MPKSNKELAVELTAAFLSSWNQREKGKPLIVNDVPELLKFMYNSVSELDSNPTDEEDQSSA